MMPMTVLGWTVKLVTLRLAPVCSSAIAIHIVALPPRELPEQEEQGNEGCHRDHQRPGEQRAEDLVVVLEVHVERDDDRELQRRHDEQYRHERRRGDEGRDVVRPDLDDRDDGEDQGHPLVLLPRRMLVHFAHGVNVDLRVRVRELIVMVGHDRQLSDEVNESEDRDPDDVDEVPVAVSYTHLTLPTSDLV